MTFREQLVELDACYESLEWVGNKSLKESWETCENIYWMIWILSKTDLDLVDPICDIAEGVLHLDKRLACSNAISAARRRANKDELDAAYDSIKAASFAASFANYSAAYAARFSSKASIADDAYCAARTTASSSSSATSFASYAVAVSAADDAATSAYYSALATAYYAASAVADASDADYYNTSCRKEEKKQCDIFRKYFTIDQVREEFNKLVEIVL